jgi:hypothetical protein
LQKKWRLMQDYKALKGKALSYIDAPYALPLAMCLLGVCIARVVAITLFALRFMDEDQALMWHAATDFANGHFYEPLFYAQDYASMLEALLAVPLLWLGIPCKFALPVVTAALALLPYVLLARWAWRYASPTLGLLVLALLAALPPEWDYITATPRGFVPGGVALVPALLWLGRKRLAGWQAFGVHLGFGLGYMLNPSFWLLCAPLAVYFLWHNAQKWHYWLGSILGGGLGLGLSLWAVSYYHAVPNRIIRTVPPLEFSLDTLGQSFNHLDRYLGHVSPVAWGLSVGLLVALALCGYVLFRKRNWAAGAALATFVALLVLSLGVNKTQDGLESVTYSYGRLFLALPLAIGVFGVWALQPFTLGRAVPWVLGAMALGFGLAKGGVAKGYTHHLVRHHVPVMDIWEMPHFQRACHHLDSLARPFTQTGQRLVVLVNADRVALAYGCHCVQASSPQIVFTLRERRNWVLAEMDTARPQHLLVVGNYPYLDSLGQAQFTGITPLAPLPFKGPSAVTYVPGEGRTVLENCRLLGIPVRPFPPAAR